MQLQAVSGIQGNSSSIAIKYFRSTRERGIEVLIAGAGTMKHFVIKTMAQARRMVMIVVGFTALIAGIAMIVLPGPAFVFIPIGLAILATEFVWARKLLDMVKERIERMRAKN